MYICLYILKCLICIVLYYICSLFQKRKRMAGGALLEWKKVLKTKKSTSFESGESSTSTAAEVPPPPSNHDPLAESDQESSGWKIVTACLQGVAKSLGRNITNCLFSMCEGLEE